jgi:hypothetical protein
VPSIAQPDGPPPRSAALSTGGLALYALIGAIALAPILYFDHPGLTDHANAVARLHILTSAPDDPVREVYEPAWGLIPNLAIDALGVALHPGLAPETTLKLVLVLSMLAVLVALPMLQTALLGRPNPLLLLAPLLLFNLAVAMGYLNYFAGLAIAMLGLWQWVRLQSSAGWMRAAFCNALSGVLFFCHIAALGFFGLVVASLEISRCWRSPGFSARALITCTGQLALCFAVPATLVALAEGPTGIPSLEWSAKPRALVAPIYVHHQLAFVLSSVAFALVVYALLRHRAVAFSSMMTLPLTALALAVVLLPSKIGLAVDVDARVMVGLVLLAVASARPLRWSPGHTRVLAIGVLAIVSLRSGLLFEQWHERARHVDALRAAFVHLQAGDSLLVAQIEDAALESCSDAVVETGNLLWHLASFAVVDRAAFVPLLFTGQGMQPIRARTDYAALDASVSTPIPLGLLEPSARAQGAEELRQLLHEKDVPDYFIGWPDHFDQLLVMHGGCAGEPPMGLGLEALAEGEAFTLYRIQRTQTAQRPRV